MIRYIHIRYADKDGNMLPKGGATIAYSFSEGVLQWGFSQCNPLDSFVKQTGRVKAAGRLKSHRCNDYHFIYNPKITEIREVLVDAFLSHKENFVYNIRNIIYKRPESKK